MLEMLLKELIEANPALSAKLVGADIIGGNVIVPAGRLTGGTFHKTPACQVVGQTGCVIAYSSFLKEPPNPSKFGRVESPLAELSGGLPEVKDPQVLCSNPTLFLEGFKYLQGPALSYYPTQPFPGLLGPFVQVPSASTPWVATPNEYAASCQSSKGANWLQLTPAGGASDPREKLLETLGPEWGTHLADMNAAMGNLVFDVGVQGAVYALTHH